MKHFKTGALTVGVERQEIFNIDLIEVTMRHSPHNIKDELLSKSLNRQSQDVTSTIYEDFDLVYDERSVTEGLIKEIKKIARKNWGGEVQDVWVHPHQPLESTNYHDHGDNDVSFVYYVSVPENSGELVFDLNTHLKGPRKSYKPKQGVCIFFPSWIPHFVTKNLSSEMRISIAGNIKILPWPQSRMLK